MKSSSETQIGLYLVHLLKSSKSKHKYDFSNSPEHKQQNHHNRSNRLRSSSVTEDFYIFIIIYLFGTNFAQLIFSVEIIFIFVLFYF